MKKAIHFARALAAFALALLIAAPSCAQFVAGQVLTASQLNSQFALYMPMAGGTLTGPLTVPTLTVTGGPMTLAATSTGTSTQGRLALADSAWAPPGTTSGSNNYFAQTLSSVSLTGGTIAQRWGVSNLPNSLFFTTTGPTGTPSTPSGMADSHTIGSYINGTVPAGLCDGQDGNGFTGPGGSPGNSCYQEIGGYESQLTILSPGHYAEGIGSYVFDNSGGSGAVPIYSVGFTSVAFKNYPANTYPWYGYEAHSAGTQQTTYAPTSAFRADGGWQNGLDLSQAAFNNAQILLPSNVSINATSTSSGTAVVTAAGGLVVDASLAGSSLTVSNQSGNGATIELAGNGATTPNKFVQASNGNFAVLNNAATTAVLTLTDGGNLSVTGSVTGGAGSLTTLTTSGLFTPSAGIAGVTNGGAAAAGTVGELLTSTTSSVSMTSNTAKNCGSLPLTAGDWDVWGNASISASASPTQLVTSINTTSNTVNPTIATVLPVAFNAGYPEANTPMTPVNVSASTTVYMPTLVVFASGTTTCTGVMYARRRH